MISITAVENGYEGKCIEIARENKLKKSSLSGNSLFFHGYFSNLFPYWVPLLY